MSASKPDPMIPTFTLPVLAMGSSRNDGIFK
jgi:hypothetical protein